MNAPQQRTALVTGASSGIGLATAKALAGCGYRVFGTSRKPAEQHPAGVAMLACDVTDDAAVAAAVANVLKAAGQIDLLVNSAGLGLFGAAEESSSEQVQSLFDVNLFGVIRMSNAVLPVMRARRMGRIVNLSTALGYVPAPFSSYYASSKFALEGYSESLDHEIRNFNIRVALVEPGTVKGNFDKSSLEPDRKLSEYQAGRDWVHGFYQKGLETADSPEKVAAAVVEAATAKQPRQRYTVGKVAWQIAVLRRLMPARLFDKALRQQYGLPS